jgi:hypothetical protein
MCHTSLLGSKFVDFLVRADKDLAAETRAAGCRRCGSTLHLNSFPRKARGIPPEWTEHFNYRLSFDCSVCGKRHTSPSVRFFDRRVFVAFAVVLGCAVQTGLTDFRMKALNRWIAVPRRTIERWRTWWSENFAKSAFFKAERGRFKPGTIEDATLPGCLLLGFEGADLSSRMQGLLRFLAPFSGRR